MFDRIFLSKHYFDLLSQIMVFLVFWFAHLGEVQTKQTKIPQNKPNPSFFAWFLFRNPYSQQEISIVPAARLHTHT